MLVVRRGVSPMKPENKQPQHQTVLAAEKECIYEGFLFVNPICSRSYHCEQEVFRFMQETDKRFYLRVIAVTNLGLCQKFFTHMLGPKMTLAEKNKLYQAVQAIAMGYKAALLQGKKCGREYLLAMQKYFGEEKQPYSKEAMAQQLEHLKMDTEMFWEDIASGEAKASLAQDMHLANQMEITCTPSLVLFNNINCQYGIKIDGGLTTEELERVIARTEKSYQRHYPTLTNARQKTKQGKTLSKHHGSIKPFQLQN